MYHYLLADDVDLASIFDKGLLPLSSRKDSRRWQEIEAWRPGFYEWIYESFAEPVLQTPYRNSGVFLTPIDFRSTCDSSLHGKARLAVPVDAIDPAASTLTYVLQGQRVVRPVTRQTLEDTASIWSEDLIQSWFSRDPSMMFFYVPQVAVYQDDGISVQPDWFDLGD